MSFLFFIFSFLSAWACPVQASDSKPLEAPTVDIVSTPLQSQRDIIQTPEATIINVHPGSQTAAEAVRALPGVSVREYSGPGSLSNVSTAESLNAGETRIQIDGIPIPDPLGTSVNILLIPAIAIERIEQPSLLSNHATPGSGIDFRLLSPTQSAPSRWKGSLRFGSGLTEQAGFAYQTQHWTSVLQASSTQGDYTYRDPQTDRSATRQHNDSRTGNAVLKFKKKFSGVGTLEVFHLLSLAGRTNPGTLNFPAETRENELLGMLGARFSGDSGLSTALSATFARTAVADATPSLSKGTTFQTSYLWKKRIQLPLLLDHEYSDLLSGAGFFSRHQLAVSARPSLRIGSLGEMGEVRVLSSLKLKKSSAFHATADVSAGLIGSLDSDRNAFLSYGYLHSLPNLPAIHGYSSNGFTLLPNPDLKLERDHVVSAGLSHQNQETSLSISTYYRRAKNQPTFVSLSEQVGQTLNTNQTRNLGLLLDMQTQAVRGLEVRSSLHLSSSRDLKTDLRLPYKAALQGLVSATYFIWPKAKVSLTVEEEYLASRFADAQNSRKLPEHWLMHWGAECPVFGEKLSFKIRNVWNTAGYVTDGFPLMGRSFWLGYQLKGTL